MFGGEDDLWNEFLEEAMEYLKTYIQIDTSEPLNVTEKAINFWKDFYVKEDIPYQVYTSPENKKSIAGYFYVADSQNAKNIVLLNHMDVVFADEKEWDFPPFSGEVKDERIMGRGAMDMKGLAIIQLMSAIYIKRQHIKLKYNICVLSVPDEETGGFEGAQFVTAHFLEELNPVYVLDEGTFGINNKKTPVFFVSYSQKKSLWLKIKVDGEEGHGACPKKENPNVMAIDILKKIQKHCIEFSDSSKTVYFNELKCRHKVLYDILHKSKMTKYLFFMKKRKSIDRILYFNTISITSIKSESSPNVIPHSVEIILDCRLLPDENVDLFIKQIYSWIGTQNVLISVIKRTDSVESSSMESELMDIIQKVVKEEMPNGKLKKIVSPVGTDSKYFRNYKINAYGFYPILLDLKDLKMMHGKNEYVSTANFDLAMKILVKVLAGFHR